MKLIKVKLALLIFVFFFFTPKIIYASTETTLYFGSVEKVLETGEMKTYYSAGNAIAVRSIKVREGTTEVNYLHSDWIGSTVLLTDNQGNRIESPILYYPYGNEKDGLPLNITDKLYTAQRKDTSLDLYFYNARYYNPKTGHFISADYAQGPNRYMYVMGNPVNNIDPTGNDCLNTNHNTCKLLKKYLAKTAEVYKQYGSQYSEPDKGPYGLGHYGIQPKERVDPTYKQIRETFEKVAEDTGISTDVWLTIGWRENALRGNWPEIYHSDPHGASGDGLMAPMFTFHNLKMKLFAPTSEGWQSYFYMYRDKDLASKIPAAFGRADYEANIYIGVAIYIDALNRMTAPEYEGYVKHWTEKGYSDYAIAYGIYNRGPAAILGDPYSEKTEFPIKKFQDTMNIYRPWENPAYCQPQGYCGFEDSIKFLNEQQNKPNQQKYNVGSSDYAM